MCDNDEGNPTWYRFDRCDVVLFCVVAWWYGWGISWEREFLAWDDKANFVDNLRLHSLVPSDVWWLWHDGVVLGVYEPVASLFKTIQIVGGGGLRAST